MSLKDISKEELETMSYDQVAYLVLEQAGKKMKLLDLFKRVCKVLNLPEETVEERITDFFELLSINKKFALLPNGYWDLATRHTQETIVEDEEESDSLELDETEDMEIEEEEEDDIFYDGDLDDTDEEDDDLKDLVIIDEDEQNQE